MRIEFRSRNWELAEVTPDFSKLDNEENKE